MSEFWQAYKHRRSMNHVMLMLAARGAIARLPPGDARDQLQASVTEYNAVEQSLRDYLDKTHPRDVSLDDPFADTVQVAA